MASELIRDAAGLVWLMLVAIVGIWWLQSQRKGRSKANTIFVANSNGSKDLHGNED
jgi:hypothetical protein